MTRYLHIAGLLVAASIPIFVLPSRLSEGQWSDPVNLIGSEFVIFFMSLACWYAIIFIQSKVPVSFFLRLLLSVLVCCVLSNIFYFTFNPYFKDFPYRTPQNQLYMSILMLSSRGVLISIILIPAAYYLKKDREARSARKENERLLGKRAEIEKELLERTVDERTKALHQTLAFLQESQDELEHQFYIQSRLIASITHDVKTPFNFLVDASKEIAQISSEKGDENLQSLSVNLTESLESMNVFVRNLLEFTKLPLKAKVSRSEDVNLNKLIAEKVELFKGIVAANRNEFFVNLNQEYSVKSNYSLLGIILHNLIDNANNYTKSDRIDIVVVEDVNSTLVRIGNPGTPLPASLVEWINSDRRSVDYAGKNEQTQGIGLVLIKELGAILDLKIQIRSDYTGTVADLVFEKFPLDL